eukprot:595685-Rhodomonas_salina.2
MVLPGGGSGEEGGKEEGGKEREERERERYILEAVPGLLNSQAIYGTPAPPMPGMMVRTRVGCYRIAMVLRSGMMVLTRVGCYRIAIVLAGSTSLGAYVLRRRSGIPLRLRYAMSGTDTAYAPISLRHVRVGCYSMYGIEVLYRAMRCAFETVYGAMRCAVGKLHYGTVCINSWYGAYLPTRMTTATKVLSIAYGAI